MMGRQNYAKHIGGGVAIKDPDSIITRIKLMQETIDENMTNGIMNALETGRIHIFTSECTNFCLGGSAAGVIDKSSFLDGLNRFGQLHEALLKLCDLPTLVLCHGAT